jgi:hypothetical protein
VQTKSAPSSQDSVASMRRAGFMARAYEVLFLIKLAR